MGAKARMQYNVMVSYTFFTSCICVCVGVDWRWKGDRDARATELMMNHFIRCLMS